MALRDIRRGRGQSGQALFVTLQQIAQGQSHQLYANTASSVALGVKQALATTTAHDVILVFGSFHTVGEFLQLL